MPCIIIKTKKPEYKIDIEGFGTELSEKMGINIERVNIIVDYFEETDAFFGNNSDIAIFNLFLSEANNEQFNKQLMQTITALAERYFSKERKNIAVICNLIRAGHMLLNEQFK